jgi:hypothetical protein
MGQCALTLLANTMQVLSTAPKGPDRVAGAVRPRLLRINHRLAPKGRHRFVQHDHQCRSLRGFAILLHIDSGA